MNRSNKMVVGLLALLASLESAVGFSASTRRTQPETSTTTIDRRSLFGIIGGVAMGPVVVANPIPAHATTEIDYSKVQDLLGGTASLESSPYTTPTPRRRPTYLEEPTEEFKQNEAKAAEFKRQNLILKREFQALLDKLDSDPNDEELLAGDLDDMRRFVKINSGLPQGITKQEVIKQVRRRKSRRFWPTNVEIAYQDLLFQIQFEQSPNTEKDADNPF